MEWHLLSARLEAQMGDGQTRSVTRLTTGVCVDFGTKFWYTFYSNIEGWVRDNRQAARRLRPLIAASLVLKKYCTFSAVLRMIITAGRRVRGSESQRLRVLLQQLCCSNLELGFGFKASVYLLHPLHCQSRAHEASSGSGSGSGSGRQGGGGGTGGSDSPVWRAAATASKQATAAANAAGAFLPLPSPSHSHPPS